LNDTLESEIGLQVARDFARKRFYSSEAKNREFYRAIRDMMRAEAVERNFVFSLSERRDDLTQWRTYGRNGKGFTIGFQSSAFLQTTSREDCDFGFLKVSYNARVHEKKVRDAFEKFEKSYEALPNNLKTPETRAIAAAHLDSVLSLYAVGYKHSSFGAEREWCLNTFIDEGDPDGDVRVRVSGNRLVPYTELSSCWEDNANLPVVCIGIGPGFRGEAAHYAVQALCRECNYKVDLYEADTPFRDV
jgi:hypothetical protein